VGVIDFIFRLGVVFAVFGFIWWLFNALLTILRGGASKNVVETYSLKFINYVFLVSVTARFCTEEYDGTPGNDGLAGNIVGGFILLMFLLGKIQKKEQRVNMIKAMGSMTARFEPVYNKTIEWVLLFASVAMLILFESIPSLMHNPITNWFVESIINIIDTPVFGFIFKVVGFFVMLRIIFKFLGGFLQLIGFRTVVQSSSYFESDQENTEKENKDEFDDYEEMK